MPIKGEKASAPRAGGFSGIALVIALVLLVIAGVTIGASLLIKSSPPNLPHIKAGNSAVSQLAANASGTVSFIDQPGEKGHSDAVKLAINGLLAPLTGTWYAAWLVNTTNNQAVALGTLATQDQGQTYTLDYTGNNTNLLGQGNEIEITLERSSANQPSGTVLLTAAFPTRAFVYIRHLLVSFAGTPGNSGLLVGLFGQAQLLNAVATQLSAYAAQHNVSAIQCLAQGMLDIIEGKSGAHFMTLPANCLRISNAGDSYGLLGNNGYISQSDAQLTLAASQSDSTINIQVHRRHIGYALVDMKGWLTTLDQDVLNLLNTTGATSTIPAIVTLANHDLYGVDLNHDGSIDYVPGEAGATIAYIHGQYMANLVLSSPS